MKKSMIRISIEGNIASGKSTIIDYLKKKILESKVLTECAKKKVKTDKLILANKANNAYDMHPSSYMIPSNSFHSFNLNIEKHDFFSQYDVNLKLITEPVEQWENLNGNNLLELMYKDPKRWAFAFQSYVQLTMLKNHIELNKVVNHFEDKSCQINIMERSIFSAKYCFIENILKSGLVEPVEYEVLDNWFNWMIENNDCTLEIIFYLRTNPETCLKRLHQRCRTAETEQISLDYLKRIHEFHELWLTDSSSSSSSSNNSNKSKYYKPKTVVIIDGDKKIDQVCDLIEYEIKQAFLSAKH